ncbi:hypothetical protein ABE871_04670 [Enterococcus gilvus]|uniref:hypothetical protein n=1 Tax=Enterococcus gilvus TaxID=160453 RepID=UPI003D6C2549
MTKPSNFVLITIIITETRDHAIEKLSDCWKLQTDLELTYVDGISGQIFRTGLGFQRMVFFCRFAVAIR